MNEAVTSTRMTAFVTLTSGVTLLVPACLGLLLSGVPTKLCPLPLLTTIPALFLTSLGDHGYYAALFVPVLLFFVWQPALWRGEAKVPRRSFVFVVIVTILNAAWLLAGWKLGLLYEGLGYTRTACLVSLACDLVVCFAFGYAWNKGSSFKGNVLLHWILFAWLAWYAFPYLGELP